MFLLPLLALIVGFAIIYAWGVTVPIGYSDYVAVAILAGLDSVFGGVRARLEKRFEHAIFATGFFTNAALAALLAYTGDRLGVNLYLAAVVALGIRIFSNLGAIRRSILDHYLHRPERTATVFAQTPE